MKKLALGLSEWSLAWVNILLITRNCTEYTSTVRILL